MAEVGVPVLLLSLPAGECDIESALLLHHYEKHPNIQVNRNFAQFLMN
jgi:hypothetical protein